MSRRNAFHCVLAFAIRSASPVDGYFSDGLGNELLNMLAKIKGLRGIARTSAFSFKGKCDDIAQHVVTKLRTTLLGNAIASAVDVAQETAQAELADALDWASKNAPKKTPLTALAKKMDAPRTAVTKVNRGRRK